jgi:hypothetical protein
LSTRAVVEKEAREENKSNRGKEEEHKKERLSSITFNLCDVFLFRRLALNGAMMQITFLIQLLLACSSLLHVSLASNVGAPIKTTSGTVTGRSARNRTDVSEYLGIRYAHPATGKLRFQPPVPFHSDKAVDAFDYSPACPFTPSRPLEYPNKSATFDSIYRKFLGRGKKTFSEDCLSLNIWTKEPNPAKLKPVVFFIHGGRFSTGTANITHYGGQYVADTGEVVMVSIKLVPLHGSQMSCTDKL